MKSTYEESNGLRKTLASGLAITLAALLLSACIKCPTCPTLPLAPPKPALTVEGNDGGICLDRDNAEALGRYILELEYALGVSYTE